MSHLLTHTTLFNPLYETTPNVRTVILFTEGSRPTVQNKQLTVDQFNIDGLMLYAITSAGKLFSASKIVNDDNPYSLFCTLKRTNLTGQPKSLTPVMTHIQEILRMRHQRLKDASTSRKKSRYSPNVVRPYNFADSSGYFIITDDGKPVCCDHTGKPVEAELPESVLAKLSHIIRK